jgi:predicted CXXCH cytochrome family protein
MPVREGKLQCSTCHNVHGSTNVKLLRKGDSISELCTSCHAEKRGPFLWEHAPSRDGCTTCHDPHGSANERMLVAKAPLLCQRCHVGTRHPSTIYDAALVGVGSNPSVRVYARSCVTCHWPSGSNHPAASGSFDEDDAHANPWTLIATLIAGVRLLPAQTAEAPKVERHGGLRRGTTGNGDLAHERHRDMSDGLSADHRDIPRRWPVDFTGQNVGRADQRLRGTIQQQGRVAQGLWDQIPMLMSNTTQTLFIEDLGVPHPSSRSTTRFSARCTSVAALSGLFDMNGGVFETSSGAASDRAARMPRTVSLSTA